MTRDTMYYVFEGLLHLGKGDYVTSQTAIITITKEDDWEIVTTAFSDTGSIFSCIYHWDTLLLSTEWFYGFLM